MKTQPWRGPEGRGPTTSAPETGSRTEDEENVTIEARTGPAQAVAARPLTELLECPPETGNLLTAAAQCVTFDAGESVFRQNGDCKGLYLVVSGAFERKAERLRTRLTLGPVRSGDLVELAAALGESRHTYSLNTVTPGAVLLLPMDPLRQAFESYPPLRMRLLEELAREVSRAYSACLMNRALPVRRRAASRARA
jgi:CRP-like cAMP-binding protein